MVWIGEFTLEVLTLSCITSKNGKKHCKNFAEFAARFLKCVWLFWDITIEDLSCYVNFKLKEWTENMLSVKSNSMLSYHKNWKQSILIGQIFFPLFIASV